MALTVGQVLDRTISKFGHRTALRSKATSGEMVSVTWGEYRAQARQVAKALIASGLNPGDAVTIIGYNSAEWVLADVGAILAGGVPAGIYTTSSPDQCQYIAEHAEAKIAFCEDAKQAAKFAAVRKNLPKIAAIVQWQGSPETEGVISWQDFLKRADATTDAILQTRMDAQKPEHLATLIYTSGTTGNPKAVMMSHDNLTWEVETVAATFAFSHTDRTISYLPLSHVAEQVLSIHAPMGLGSAVTFAESLEKLPEALREVRPTYFLGVPRVWEKIQAKMVATGATAKPLQKKIAAWAKDLGLRGGYAREKGHPLPLLYPVADKLVFSKVREKLGLDQCRLIVTSAAPIARSTLEYFRSLGIELTEVYGMSECTGGGTVPKPGKARLGKVGCALAGTEVKVAADGELCLRGRNVFMGYLKDDAATKESLDGDGWLHTGDIGTIDHEGYVQITDRKKELIITAGGENIAPQMIEGKLKSIRGIAQAAVIGDRRKYVTALLVLDREQLPELAKQAGLTPFADLEAANASAEIRKYLDAELERINAELARVQTVKRFTLLPCEFGVDGGELTPTMKLKRRVITEKYKAEIEAMYPAEDA
jgi:long-subunit acyl-CoA synthetase (AMP-forming)